MNLLGIFVKTFNILDFLDVTLDLRNGIYKPYCKPNNTPVYVNAKSNHHPSIIKAIPLGVNKRLNMISSNEEVFKEKAPMYQKALDKAGHKHKLVYEDIDIHSLNKKKKQRKKKVIYFVPLLTEESRQKLESCSSKRTHPLPCLKQTHCQNRLHKHA